MDAGRHPLIEVITNAEVIGCEGEPGKFRARVRKNPRYVKEDVCVACGLCVDKCPQVGGNEFDVGLKFRKAIYRPFPQSVPAAYVIDREACLNDKILVCEHCVQSCDVDAIDFDMPAEEFEIDVGSVLVAVGFQEFDARKLGNYGYGRFPNVVTSLELERMLTALRCHRRACGAAIRSEDAQTRGVHPVRGGPWRRRPAVLQPFLLHERREGLLPDPAARSGGGGRHYPLHRPAGLRQGI